MKRAVGILVMILAISCTSRKTKEVETSEDSVRIVLSTPVIGKYLYKDANNVTHVKSSCFIISRMEWSEDNSPRNTALRRLLVDTISVSDIEYSCSACITDSIYEELYQKTLKY